jgi:hypothetical protein
LFQALLEAVFKRMVERSGTCERTLKLQDPLITSSQTTCETRCNSISVFETGSPVCD